MSKLVQAIADRLSSISVSNTEETNGHRARGGGEDRSSKIFTCFECDITYLDFEMGSCPKCDGPVETVPSESDLGFGTGES